MNDIKMYGKIMTTDGGIIMPGAHKEMFTRAEFPFQVDGTLLGSHLTTLVPVSNSLGQVSRIYLIQVLYVQYIWVFYNSSQ